MSDVKTLKSYLVGLGFKVDAKQYRDFQSVLAGAAKSVQSETAKIGSSLLKWEIGVIGLFTTVSGAILGTMDKVAMADQDFRLFGERMFLSTQNARSLKIALDALGQPLEAVAFDPELHGRFLQLQKDQATMAKSIGMGDNDSTLRKIRDFNFQLTRLKVEIQWFEIAATKSIFKALFGDDGDKAFERISGWVDWISKNIPFLASKFAEYVVPVMKDTWNILKDVGVLLGILGTEFSNLVGILSGDSSLEGSTFSFDKFARSIGKVVHGIAELLDFVIRLEKHLPVLEVLGGAAAGAGVGGTIGLLGGPIGAGGGALLGGVAGGVLGLLGRSGRLAGATAGAGGASGVTADQARELAKRVSRDTGIPADIVFAQWAHETGDFTNRGAKSLNNLAGIRSGNQYRSYSSLDDFANDFEKVISNKRYTGITGAKSTDEYASILKRGGYYGDTLSNYQSGMKNFEPQYFQGGSGSTHVTVGDINIMQPNASADEIAHKVTSEIAAQKYKQTQRNLTELQTVFQ